MAGSQQILETHVFCRHTIAILCLNVNALETFGHRSVAIDTLEPKIFWKPYAPCRDTIAILCLNVNALKPFIHTSLAIAYMNHVRYTSFFAVA